VLLGRTDRPDRHTTGRSRVANLLGGGRRPDQGITRSVTTDHDLDPTRFATAVPLQALEQRALEKKALVLKFTSNQACEVSAKVRLHGKVIAKFSKEIRSGTTTVKVRLGGKALARLRRVLQKRKTTELVLKLAYADAGGATTDRSQLVTIRS
jgi:hypothetical protein